jgi:hypothetical protein
MEDCEGGRTPLKVGIARVDNEGGFLIWGPLLGLDGKEGPTLPTPRVELLAVWVSEVSSANITASKYGWRPVVNIDSGTRIGPSVGQN